MAEGMTYSVMGTKRFQEWRRMFKATQIEYALKPASQAKVSGFRFDGSSFSCDVNMGSYHYSVSMGELPGADEDWDDVPIYCNCRRAVESRRGTNRRDPWFFDFYEPEVWQWHRCNHMAIALAHWERRLGELYGEGEGELSKEQRERNQAYVELSKEELPADYPFRDRERPQNIISRFDVGAMLKARNMTTNRFFVNEFEKLRAAGSPPVVQVVRDKVGGDYLRCQKSYPTNGRFVHTSGEVRKDSLYFTCGCADPRGQGVLCAHMLDVLGALMYEADRLPLADQTDTQALSIIQGVLQAQPDHEEDVEEVQVSVEEAPSRIATFSFEPLVSSTGSGALSVAFLLGPRDGTLYVQYDLEQTVDAWERRTTFAYGPRQNHRVNFATHDIDEASVPWMELAVMLRDEVRGFNEVAARLLPDSFGAGTKAKLGESRPLKGKLLDRFYEIALASPGRHFFFDLAADAKNQHYLVAGTTDLKIKLSITRDTTLPGGAEGPLAGIRCMMKMPVVHHGEAHDYMVLDEGIAFNHVLAVLDDAQVAAARPLMDQMGVATRMYFTVGLGHMRDFYRRVLPALESSGVFEIEDACAEEVEAVLVPDGSMRFFVDLDEGDLVCEATVVYGDREVGLLDPRNDFAREQALEERARNALEKTFGKPQLGDTTYRRRASDTFLFEFITGGLADLEQLGEVEVSEALSNRKVLAVPEVRLEVGVDQGLLDLTVVTDDMSDEELLALFGSYRRRSNFYKLKNGSFVDLRNKRDMDSLLMLLQEMELDVRDAVGKHATLPLFRSHYLDLMMEQRQGLVARRDETFSSLVGEFEHVRDATYELPQGLEATLRPYQETGYKWLRVLNAAGFGGILADEMGLGKTLQTIAMLAATAESDLPALVVCPASVVYNWQDEFGRFAPSLKVEVVAGAARARHKQIECMDETDTRVYITSYDLLRRDVISYTKCKLGTVVLDEAQYIKNPQAAVTKAAKSLPSTMRLALTGTPVENRLSELWSIFDFLMPGFLYSQKEFKERFEQPISRTEDGEATNRLRAMVGPFIMRRRKEEVLKDLPQRLEEVRSTRLSGEQRRLYDAQVVRVRQMLTGMGESGQEKIQILAEITRLRQLCCDPSLVFEDYKGPSAKRALCLELVASAIDGEHRVLLFSQFTTMLDLIEGDLRKRGIDFFRIDGSTPKAERVSLAHRFNDEGERPVFLVSLKAGGTGLNLTGADVVIHYDPWWNVAAQDQATGRAHRIGQTREVNVYRLVARDTIEDRILALQEKKRDLADAIVEGKRESLMSMSKDDLLDLLGS